MFEKPDGKEEKDRSLAIMLLSAVAVLIVIGLIILVPYFRGPATRVEMATQGSPEFDSYVQYVKIGELDKRVGERMTNANYGRLRFTVENTGDKVLTGLELRSAVIGFNNEVLKQKTTMYIPNQRDSLDPNRSIRVELSLEPIPDESQIMDFKVEVVGLKVEQ
ncbi:MAG: hypothetical protein L0229_11495 [Blastocatellia bacterium]|nr:hypothetical protein [Blastocatellia bacterium]